MIRIRFILALGISLAACQEVAPKPSTVNDSLAQQQELRPIEVMALFREAVASQDWDSVRSGLAEDDESIQTAVEVYKNEKNGHWLIVPVAEAVRDDVAVVIVSYRLRDVRSYPSAHPVLMVKLDGKWMIVDSERTHWRVSKEQGDRVLALSRDEGVRLSELWSEPQSHTSAYR